MSSRGTYTINGHVTSTEYIIVRNIYDAKVLIGSTNQQHGLPDYAHSPNAIYIKEKSGGGFREMRIYDETGFPLIEIGYHPEPQISRNRHEYVLHYHSFGRDLSRHLEGELSETSNAEIYKKYKKYLERYGL